MKEPNHSTPFYGEAVSGHIALIVLIFLPLPLSGYSSTEEDEICQDLSVTWSRVYGKWPQDTSSPIVSDPIWYLAVKQTHLQDPHLQTQCVLLQLSFPKCCKPTAIGILEKNGILRWVMITFFLLWRLLPWDHTQNVIAGKVGKHSKFVFVQHVKLYSLHRILRISLQLSPKLSKKLWPNPKHNAK